MLSMGGDWASYRRRWHGAIHVRVVECISYVHCRGWKGWVFAHTISVWGWSHLTDCNVPSPSIPIAFHPLSPILTPPFSILPSPLDIPTVFPSLSPHQSTTTSILNWFTLLTFTPCPTTPFWPLLLSHPTLVRPLLSSHHKQLSAESQWGRSLAPGRQTPLSMARYTPNWFFTVQLYRGGGWEGRWVELGDAIYQYVSGGMCQLEP